MFVNSKVSIKLPESDKWVDLSGWSKNSWSDYQEVKIKEPKCKYEGLLPKVCLVQKKVNLTSKFTIVEG